MAVPEKIWALGCSTALAETKSGGVSQASGPKLELVRFWLGCKKEFGSFILLLPSSLQDEGEGGFPSLFLCVPMGMCRQGR